MLLVLRALRTMRPVGSRGGGGGGGVVLGGFPTGANDMR